MKLTFNFFLILRELALGIGVAVLIPSIAHYTVKVFVHEPRERDYVHVERVDDSLVDRLDPAYKEAKARYESIYFLVVAFIGLLSLLIGTRIPVASLGMGFILGGLACLTMGYVSYWHRLLDFAKLISLVVALAIILGVGYRLFHRR